LFHRSGRFASSSALTLSVSASAKGPTIITFDPPGSILTEAFDITPQGRSREATLTRATSFTASCVILDGTFTMIDAPGAQGTIAWNINPNAPKTRTFEVRIAQGFGQGSKTAKTLRAEACVGKH
jgi:hypothetical protein